jgi:hypothetical protein
MRHLRPFEMLLRTKEHPKEHELHDRGQLMLIERMLGIVRHLTWHMQVRRAAASSSFGAPRVFAPRRRYFAIEACRRLGVRMVSSPTCSRFALPRKWTA